LWIRSSKVVLGTPNFFAAGPCFMPLVNSIEGLLHLYTRVLGPIRSPGLKRHRCQ
jgi:hypothetical protein